MPKRVVRVQIVRLENNRGTIDYPMLKVDMICDIVAYLAGGAIAVVPSGSTDRRQAILKAREYKILNGR